MTRTSRSDTTVEQRLMGCGGQWVPLPVALSTAVRMGCKTPAERDVAVIILELWQGQQATRKPAALSTRVEVSSRRVAVRIVGPDASNDDIENRRKTVKRCVESLVKRGVFKRHGTGKRGVWVLCVGPALNAAATIRNRGRLDPGQARATGVTVSGSTTGVTMSGSETASGVTVSGNGHQPGSPRPRCPGSPRPPYLEETSSPPSSGKKKSLDEARSASSAGGPAAPRASVEEPDEIPTIKRLQRIRADHHRIDANFVRRAEDLISVPLSGRDGGWDVRALALIEEVNRDARAISRARLELEREAEAVVARTQETNRRKLDAMLRDIPDPL